MNLGLIPYEASSDGVKAVRQNGANLVPQARQVRDGGPVGVNEILSKTIDGPESVALVPTGRSGDAGEISNDSPPLGSRDQRATDCPKTLPDGTTVQPR